MNLLPRQSLFDSWFDDDFPSFRLLPEKRSQQNMLAVDIDENEQGFSLKADFPGLKKEEISVTVDHGTLTLSAEHKEEKEEKSGGKVIRRERRSGVYSRSFALGQDIDETKISANFSDGVLTLQIPKSAPHEVQRKSIPIS